MTKYKTSKYLDKEDQKERYFLLKNNFNLPHAGNFGLEKCLNDNKQFSFMEMFEGDIINLKVYKASHSTLYTYLVYYQRNDFKIDCGYETSMSLDFILINNMIFEEVTDVIIRDKKINELLG